MTKYSSSFKIRLVKEYQTGVISIKGLAKKYHIPSDAQLHVWINQAEAHGLNSLKVKQNKYNYSQDFKLGVVNYVKTNEVSRMQTAAHFGISPSQVNSWVRKFQEMGAAGLRDRPRGRPSQLKKAKKKKVIKKLNPTKEEKYKEEIIQLKAQLHDTEMDRDILKVLTALRNNQSKH